VCCAEFQQKLARTVPRLEYRTKTERRCGAQTKYIASETAAEQVTRKEVSPMTRRIKVRGVRLEELDDEKLALAYWLMAKRAVAEKREREAADKRKRLHAKPGGRS
jgi:hypothetical protein